MATLADVSNTDHAIEQFDDVVTSTAKREAANTDLDRTRRNLEGTAAEYVDETSPPTDSGAHMDFDIDTDLDPFEPTDTRTRGTCAVEVDEGDIAIFQKPTALAANEWEDWESDLDSEDLSERELTEVTALTLAEWAVSDDRNAAHWLSNFGRIDLQIITRMVRRGGNPQARPPD